MIRQLAMALLTDEHGISEDAYVILEELLADNDCFDIIILVKATDGRFYLKT